MTASERTGDNQSPDFDEWLRYGISHGWCGPVVCYTHDGIPVSAVEDDHFINGGEPCVHILRVYEDQETRKAVETYFTPYGWRMPLSLTDDVAHNPDTPF